MVSHMQNDVRRVPVARAGAHVDQHRGGRVREEGRRRGSRSSRARGSTRRTLEPHLLPAKGGIFREREPPPWAQPRVGMKRPSRCTSTWLGKLANGWSFKEIAILGGRIDRAGEAEVELPVERRRSARARDRSPRGRAQGGTTTCAHQCRTGAARARAHPSLNWNSGHAGHGVSSSGLKNGSAVHYGERGAGHPRAPPVSSRTRRPCRRAPPPRERTKASGGCPAPRSPSTNARQFRSQHPNRACPCRRARRPPL